MIELKAELIKKRQEYEENKKNKSVKNLIKCNKSKGKNEYLDDKIVSSNNLKKKNLSLIEEEDLKKSRDALETKSKLYKKLEKGRLLESDLNPNQRENLMVDFAWKGWNSKTEDFEFNEISDDEEVVDDDVVDKLGADEVLKMVSEDNFDSLDRWIEYEDEFGRSRVSKLSELRKIHQERQEIHQHLHLQRQISSHYDGDAEIRNKGVGFYRFARDEEERGKQMVELKRLREETLEKRMRTLLMKEQRRLRIETRLSRLKQQNNR